MTIFRHAGKSTTGPSTYSKFVAKWDTTQAGSADDTIVLPLVADGTYDFYIDWGDGNRDTITGHDQPEVTHQYSDTGIYTIQLVANDMIGWQFNDSGDDDKLVEIMEWGPLRFVSDDTNLFKGCSNLTLSTTSNPPFNADAAGMFQDCSSLTGTGGDILNWDVGSVTGMDFMLAGCTSLDADLSNWDVSAVKSAEGFMSGAGLSTMNYDRVLSGWSSQSVQSGVNISFGDTRYSKESGEVFRDLLTSASTGWNISDGGMTQLVIPRFVTTWDTTKTDSSHSPSNTLVRFPIVPNGSYDFFIDWGDGTEKQNITSYNDSNKNHAYSSPGIYTITVTGLISGWRSMPDRTNESNADARAKLVSIDQMDGLQILNPSDANNLNDVRFVFGYLANLTGLPGDFLNVDSSGYMERMFFGSSLVGTQPIPQISGWNMSKVKNLKYFWLSTPINENIGAWDVSNVHNFEGTFYHSTAFNNGGSPDINNWDTSSATSMSTMFFNAYSFNQPIGDWDVSSVEEMQLMFYGTPFNNGGSSNISGWNPSSCTNFNQMFNGTPFNQPIGSWDTSSVQYVSYTFNDTPFNQPIGGWNMGSATNITSMLRNTPFDQDLGSWNVSAIDHATNFLAGGTLSTSNYDSLLQGWAPQSVNNGVSISFGNSRYSAGSAASARSTLVSKGWTITDGGQA